jgi:hypothetical protein
VISISPLSGYLFVDVEGSGVMKFDLHEVTFNRREANKLKNVTAPEKGLDKELEKVLVDDEKES